MKKEEISFKKVYDKQNIFLLIILILIFIIIFIALTMINFVFDFKNDTLLKNPSARTIYVSGKENEKDFKPIASINHVEYYLSSKYMDGIYTNASEFDSEELKGKLQIYPLIKNEEISIIDGRNIENELEAVCPAKFYPHDIYIFNEDKTDYTTKIISSKMLKGASVIGKEFNISNYDVKETKNKNITVKIVGTYDNTKIMLPLNACFISKKDFDKISLTYSGYIDYVDVNGNKGRDYNDYSGQMIRVDNYKNIPKVLNKLNELGFSARKVYQFDEGALNLILYIPLMVAIIAIIVATGIIYNFLNKKIKLRHTSYGILCTLGYPKKDIKKLEFIENIFVLIIASIVSIVIYLILYKIILVLLLSEFTYNSVNINIPIIPIILTIIVFILIIYLINQKAMKKLLANDIVNLLKEE